MYALAVLMPAVADLTCCAMPCFGWLDTAMPCLQMYAMPVFDMAESLCAKKGIRNKLFTRVFVRSLFVVFTAFVGISIPFFGDLLGFFGGMQLSRFHM